MSFSKNITFNKYFVVSLLQFWYLIECFQCLFTIAHIENFGDMCQSIKTCVTFRIAC